MTDAIAQVLPVLVATHALAVAIVNLTPTPKDNEALGAFHGWLVRAYRLVEIAAGILGPLAKR